MKTTGGYRVETKTDLGVDELGARRFGTLRDLILASDDALEGGVDPRVSIFVDRRRAVIVQSSSALFRPRGTRRAVERVRTREERCAGRAFDVEIQASLGEFLAAAAIVSVFSLLVAAVFFVWFSGWRSESSPDELPPAPDPISSQAAPARPEQKEVPHAPRT